MKKNKLIILILCNFIFAFSYGQKYKYAERKSFLNKKSPEFIAYQWLGKVPKMEDKFVLLEFWSTSCRPCLQLISKLNSFQEVFRNELVVVGITSDSIENINLHIQNIKYYLILDPHQINSSCYQVRALPYAVLIDPQGIFRWEGYPAYDKQLLTKSVIQNIIDSNFYEK